MSIDWWLDKWKGGVPIMIEYYLNSKRNELCHTDELRKHAKLDRSQSQETVYCMITCFMKYSE